MDDREGKLLEYFFEALGLLSADQNSIRWLATHGKELTMVQKDVFRGWHGTCNVERNLDGLEQNEANGRDARKFRLYFRHGLRRRFIKGGFILTVIERELAQGAARQNAHFVKAAVAVPKNRDWMTMC